MKGRIQERLKQSNDVQFCLFAGLAAFATYFCMYAFRRPFGAASFTQQADLYGINFKIFITISQLIGYCASKYIGVKIVSESTYESRGKLILKFILTAFAALFFFAVVPNSIKPVFMLINGLSLGMIWGLVCGFLEGRRTSDILGAILSASFILASGYIKQLGNYLVVTHDIPEIWMPFFVGLIFIPITLLSLFLLSCLPEPDEKDKSLKQERLPISKNERWKFFAKFYPGLVALILIYILLTVFRSVRDDFAAEFWKGAGLGGQPGMFSASETPIAFVVTGSLIILYFVKSNQLSYTILNFMMILGVSMLGISGIAYTNGWITPLSFMIISGVGTYMAYVPFGCVLFDNLTALLGLHYTCGFLIAFADAIGYSGTVICYIYKNFFASGLNWHDFLVQFSLLTSAVAVIAFLFSFFYFRKKMLQA